MVAINDTWRKNGIVVRIVEVIPYRRYRGAGRWENWLLIGYRIEEGNKKTPVAHFWMKETDNIEKYIERVVRHYLSVKEALR